MSDRRACGASPFKFQPSHADRLAGLLIAAGLVIVAGDLLLIMICWTRRSALAGLLGAIGIPLTAYAIVFAPTRGARGHALLIAAIALVVGIALYSLGQMLQRLLHEEPEDVA